MVVQNPFSWLARRCTPLNKIQADVLFCDLPLSWARNGWPSWSPLFCHNPLDMTRYRCFSGVRLTDQGPQRKRMVASLRDNEDLSASQPSIFTFSFAGLDPDGCLVADQWKVHTITIENSGADKQKGLIPNWRLTLQKKTSFFAMERCFLLTGAF